MNKLHKIGIIGSGDVGISLAKGFLKYGYETTIASRSGVRRDELEAEIGEGIMVNTPRLTALNNDIIIFAVKGSQAMSALENLDIENIKGKIIIDTTNPIAELPPEDGVLRYYSQINKSLMEELQSYATESFFVKAFSCVGSNHMVNPDFDDKPTMFICGNNDEAKRIVTEILSLFGWDTEDLGNTVAARAIEPLSMLYCIPGLRDNTWNHAFKLMRKKEK